MTNECEGCNTFAITHGKCLTKMTMIESGDNDLVCPCSICLVKMMCSYPCNELKAFYQNLRKMNIEGINNA